MRVLPDTSIWIDHLHRPNRQLIEALDQHEVFSHSMVVGEIACGGIKNRTQVIGLLCKLPFLPDVARQEVLALIEDERLWSKGLGWADAHLLAATKAHRCILWTADRALKTCAGKLGIGRV